MHSIVLQYVFSFLLTAPQIDTLQIVLGILAITVSLLLIVAPIFCICKDVFVAMRKHRRGGR